LVERYERDFLGREDDEEDEEEEMHDDSDTRLSMRSRKRKTVPLVVNTMGWTKGLGADLNARIEEVVRGVVEGVVTFTMGGADGEAEDGGSDDRSSRHVGGGEGKGAYAAFGGGNAYPSGLAGMDVGMMASLDPALSARGQDQGGTGGAGGKRMKTTYHLSPPSPSHIAPLSKKWTSADWRTVGLMSWFYGDFDHGSLTTISNPGSTSAPGSSSRQGGRQNQRQRTIKKWNVASPLLCQPPLEVCLPQALDKLVLSGAGYEDVVPGEVGRVVNGGLVGVAVRDRDQDANYPDDGDERGEWEGDGYRYGEEREGGEKKRNVWGYSQGSAPPSPYHTRCVGVALVRGVHPSLLDHASASVGGDVQSAKEGEKESEAKVHLLTPIPVNELMQSRVWVKGELEMPVWGMLDWRGWASGRGSGASLTALLAHEDKVLTMPSRCVDDKRNESVELVVDPEGSSNSSVPYLQWGRADLGGRVVGGEKKRVRRNLMRRGQQ
jgi:polynucleotide 5'-hydroxyl-kinase GRC3/NOL9